ncbi:MAG: hypothetical protein K2I07_08280 [Lachnospiraceae bacterium]|nr:hypothetical protein [Lachnospiraceae bacterium]
MMRLIKMELYRLVHAISTRVMIIVVAGVAVLMSFALRMDLNMMEAEQKTPGQETGTESQVPAESFASGFSDGWASAEEGSTEDDFTFGVTAQADESWIGNDMKVGDILMSELQGCLLVVFIAIFVPLFVNAEQKRGYIKNIAGQIPRREMLALSKLPAVAVQVFILFVVFMIANLVSDAIFFRGRIVLKFTGALFRTLGMQYVLHAAWGCLIALFTMVTRSTAFAMTTGILLASGIVEMLIMYLNRVICSLLPSAEQFNLMRYTLNYATEAMTVQSTLWQIGGFLTLALVYIAASAVIAGIVYRKRDVR